MKSLAIAFTIVGLALVGCSKTAPSSVQLPAVVRPSMDISGLPVTLTVKQRSTTFLPGTGENLSVTVDDITSGQVMVSLIRKDGSSLMGPISMKCGDSATFRFGDSKYSLRLKELNNALIGEDFASFTIASAGSETITEIQKIERLIQYVESMSGVVFRRNGTEYSAMDAAKHLRLKLDSSTAQISNAAQFIDLVASKSSITGQDYEVRFPDGRTVPASVLLRDVLIKLEEGR